MNSSIFSFSSLSAVGILTFFLDSFDYDCIETGTPWIKYVHSIACSDRDDSGRKSQCFGQLLQ